MPNITYDIIIIAVILLSALWGYKKGFILTLCGFLTLFVAFFGALYLSNLLAAPVGQLFLPSIEQTIIDIVPVSPPLTSTGIDTPPLDSVLQALEAIPFLNALVEPLEYALSQMDISDAIHAVSTAIATQIARIVVFFLSFILVMIAWVLMSRVLDLAFRLPVLSTLNAWSGFLIGLTRGLVLVFVAVWFLKLHESHGHFSPFFY